MEFAFKIGLSVAILLFGIFTLFVATLNESSTTKAERICRNKALGCVLTLGGLILCIPQATAVAWPWLVAMIIPLVVIFTLLFTIFLDSLVSRAVGGLLILGAYYYVNYAFSLHSTLQMVLTLIAFGLAIAGMFISARPYLLRDFLRKCCCSKQFRLIAFSGSSLVTLLLVLELIFMMVK